MSITDNGRSVTTVTVSRTHSLRDPPRQTPRDEQIPLNNGMLMKNQRSFSNDKIASDYKAQPCISQRGSSLRHTNKTTFPNSSPITNNHHSFQIINTSPRTSESIIDPDFGKTSQKFKFKPRNYNGSQGGPLLIDHGLKMDPQIDNKTFTPRPPLNKKMSSDQEDTNSDIESNQSGRRIIPNQKINVPRQMRSPNRVSSHNLKESENNCQSSFDKQENSADVNEEYYNGIEEVIASDCEVPPQFQSGSGRSSLRKGSDSPINSDMLTRNSPSPTKTVKFNTTLHCKTIPNSSNRNKDIKTKSRKPKPSPNKDDFNDLFLTTSNNIGLVEAHELFITECTNLMKIQMSLMENFREKKISSRYYQKDLIENIEKQKKLLLDFHLTITNCPTNYDNSKL